MLAALKRQLGVGRRAASSSPTALTPPSKLLAAPPLLGFEAVSLLTDVATADKGLKAVTLPSSGTPVVIVSHAGELHALYGKCPHKVADMALGDIEDSDAAQGACLKCPRHRKKFNGGLNFRLADGHSWVHLPCVGKYDPTWTLPVFDVRVHEGFVYISSLPKVGTIPELRVASEDEGEEKKGKKVPVQTIAVPSASGAGAGVELLADIEGSTPAVTIAAVPVAHRHASGSEEDWMPVDIVSITPHTHDTSVYRFVNRGTRIPRYNAQFADSWHVGLEVKPSSRVPGCSAFSVSREYTPISPLSAWTQPTPGELPYLDILIKHYASGALTSRLLALGTSAEVSATSPQPTLKLPEIVPMEMMLESEVVARRIAYDECVSGSVGGGSTLVLIAGGTGITPMLQLARWALATPRIPSRPTSVILIASNHTEADVLCRQTLLDLVAAHPGAMQLVFTFSRSAPVPASEAASAAHAHVLVNDSIHGPAVRYTSGRIHADLLTGVLPPRTHVRRVVVSGPKGMFESVTGALMKIGYCDATDAASLLVELEA